MSLSEREKLLEMAIQHKSKTSEVADENADAADGAVVDVESGDDEDDDRPRSPSILEDSQQSQVLGEGEDEEEEEVEEDMEVEEVPQTQERDDDHYNDSEDDNDDAQSNVGSSMSMDGASSYGKDLSPNEVAELMKDKEPNANAESDIIYGEEEDYETLKSRAVGDPALERILSVKKSITKKHTRGVRVSLKVLKHADGCVSAVNKKPYGDGFVRNIDITNKNGTFTNSVGNNTYLSTLEALFHHAPELNIKNSDFKLYCITEAFRNFYVKLGEGITVGLSYLKLEEEKMQKEAAKAARASLADKRRRRKK